MTTRTANGRVAAALRKKILLFYDHLNRREFEWCYRTVDLRIREKPTSITLYQYTNSLKHFLERHGAIKVRPTDLELELHVDQPTALFQNRDFAVGVLTWEDQSGERHTMQERWVRNRGRWYTLCTGLVTLEP